MGQDNQNYVMAKIILELSFFFVFLNLYILINKYFYIVCDYIQATLINVYVFRKVIRHLTLFIMSISAF